MSYRPASGATWRAAHRAEIVAYRIAYRETHREAIATRMAAWRAAHRAEISAAARSYRLANPDKVAASKRASESTHKAEIAARGAAYKAAHPERRREHIRQAKAIRRGASLCVHMDHVVPLALGGAHCADNLKPSCATCNMRKGARP